MFDQMKTIKTETGHGWQEIISGNIDFISCKTIQTIST